MRTYAVVGASRGIGLQFVRHLSQQDNTRVFGVYRNAQTASELLTLHESQSNVYAVRGDLDDAISLRAAADEVSKLNEGTLDFLICNGAALTCPRSDCMITTYPDPKLLEEDYVNAFRTNTLGTAHAINAFLPLLRAGNMKKIIVLTSGGGDINFTRDIQLSWSTQYTISKAALNMVITQFALALAAEPRVEGQKAFTVLGLTPGVVSSWSALPKEGEEMSERMKTLFAGMKRYAPHWDEVPLTPAQSVDMMMKVIERVGPEDSGAILSHLGTRRWL